jgi:hypothetical protein
VCDDLILLAFGGPFYGYLFTEYSPISKNDKFLWLRARDTGISGCTKFIIKGTESLQGVRLSPRVQICLRGFLMDRVVNGKIAERWGVLDLLGVRQQLGV